MATWETVEKVNSRLFSEHVSHTFLDTERMQVPGGWLVRTVLYNGSGSYKGDSVSMVFVPDLSHEWKVD